VSSKIGGVSGNGQTAALGAGRGAQRSQDAAANGAQTETSGRDAESVQITGAARQLSSLEQAVRDLPAVNTAKVAQITNSLAQGTYTIDSQHIASKLMQMEQDLGRVSGSQDTDPEANPE
jgi:negative regulator of flagellin synthesis FlgM